jgi:hypothetical protein
LVGEKGVAVDIVKRSKHPRFAGFAGAGVVLLSASIRSPASANNRAAIRPTERDDG